MVGLKGIDRDSLFWSKVDQKENYECWPWKASTNKDGYGQFWIGDTYVPAHRYAYCFVTREYITSEDLILHHCDNPSCCNPRHLFRGTAQDNVNDKMSKGRHGFKAHPRNYEGEVWLMRRLYSAGISSNKVARMFKRDQGSTYRLLHNTNYTYKEAI